jgi:hypothetical protein
MVTSSGKVEFALSEPKLEVVRMKWVRRIFTSGVAVFAGAHEKITRENNEVHDSLAGFCCIGVRNNWLNEMAEDPDRDRLDRLWRGICLRAVPKLVLETEVNVALTVYTRVWGPHVGERLAHKTEQGRH